MEKKIYHYKNGSFAVFENDNKVVFNREEYKALFNEVSFGMPEHTDLYWYIQEKIRIQRNNRYAIILFSECLEEYRRHNYETKQFEKVIRNKQTKGTLIYENGDLVLVSLLEPREMLSYKGLKNWESALEFSKLL